MNKLVVARTGNEAMAEAMRQINPDVVAAYPITPATEIVQIFSSFVADGLVDTEFVAVESEHSAMSACIGASSAGVRVMTGTSSQGLALMAEMLYIASGMRLPIVMADVNRALSAPINIHCDHSDTMSVRDSGWIQIFSENAQEAYDNMIQAVRIAESVSLPVMVTTDGFIISHGMETVEIMTDKAVSEFVGEYSAEHSLLDIDNPITAGGLDFTDFYFEHRRAIAQAMTDSKATIKKVADDFNNSFGRSYGFFDAYKLSDAEIAIVALGSTAGTIKAVVDELREEGIKAGVLKLRVFRPFPVEEILDTLRSVKAVAVFDRSDALADAGGPVYMELRSVLYDLDNRIKIYDYIYGLGGRDITLLDIKNTIKTMLDNIKENNNSTEVSYIGVRN